MSNSFESLAEKAKNFGAMLNFDQKVADQFPTFDSQISAFENQKNEILAIQKEEIKTIEDKDYLEITIKAMIKIGLRILEVAAANIKIGATGKELEGIAAVYSSVLESVKELREFRKMLLDIENFQNAAVPAVPAQQNIQINIDASSSEMAEMIEKIKRESQLRNVEAKFDIGTEKQY